MKKLRLKQRWKGFLKRSTSYKVSVLYLCLTLFCVVFGVIMVSISLSTYRDEPTSYMIETPEQLRTVVFLTFVALFGGIAFLMAGFCFALFLFFAQDDHAGRIRMIETFISMDPYLSESFKELKEALKKEKRKKK